MLALAIGVGIDITFEISVGGALEIFLASLNSKCIVIGSNIYTYYVSKC